MKSLIKLLPLLFLCSCQAIKYSATSPTKTQPGKEDFVIASFGGSRTIDTAGGTRYTSNENKTAGQFFQTAGIGVGAYYKNATNSSNNINATAQQANGRLPLVVPAQQTAPNTTVYPLVVPPANPIIPNH